MLTFTLNRIQYVRTCDFCLRIYLRFLLYYLQKIKLYTFVSAKTKILSELYFFNFYCFLLWNGHFLQRLLYWFQESRSGRQSSVHRIIRTPFVVSQVVPTVSHHRYSKFQKRARMIKVIWFLLMLFGWVYNQLTRLLVYSIIIVHYVLELEFDSILNVILGLVST